SLAPLTSMTMRSGAARVNTLCCTGPDRSKTRRVLSGARHRRTPRTAEAASASAARAANNTPTAVTSAPMRITNPIVSCSLLAAQGLAPGLPSSPMPLQQQRTAARLGTNGNVQVRLWQNARAALRPFDQTQSVAFEVIADAEKLQLLGIDQAVQIEMEGSHIANLVGLDQGEGRTLDRTGMPQATQDAARQSGLAGAQVTVQIDGAHTTTDLGDRRAQRQHRGLVGRLELHFTQGQNSSSNVRLV